jgi:hypothetical protein
MKLLLVLAAALLAALLGQRVFLSFAAQKVSDYAGTGPAFDIRTHLAGPILSEGVIYGPDGRVSSRFVADMQGDWTGNSGTLAEHFRFAGGKTQDRLWTLTMGEGGRFTATADDIVGMAKGEQQGAVARITYRLRLPDASGGHVLDVIDWLYLMENGTIMNRSEMRKFGVKVAELVATMRPAP